MGNNLIYTDIQQIMDIACESAWKIATMEYKKTKKWPRYFKVRNTIKSFKQDEIVRCTINNYLYKIYAVESDHFIIAEVSLDSEFLRVDPRFLEKAEVNKEWIKVLYE